VIRFVEEAIADECMLLKVGHHSDGGGNQSDDVDDGDTMKC